jgi:uncharacterized protein
MLGLISELRVVREADFGFFLANEAGDEVLLPSRYVPEGTKLRDLLEVFVYRDSEGRLTATTEHPKAVLGEFVCLEVVGTARAGAFLDLGLAKDLLVPRREQNDLFREGEWRVVKICLDEQTDRLYGAGDLRKHVSDFADCYKAGDEVQLMIFEETDLGYKAIVDDSYWGLLYDSEVFTDLEEGQRMRGFVKPLRPDKKLDISLQAPGYSKVAGVEAQVLEAVKADDGFLPLTSKSSPEAIYARFGVSKKAFKLAVSALYKKRMVTLEDAGIRLAGRG